MSLLGKLKNIGRPYAYIDSYGDLKMNGIYKTIPTDVSKESVVADNNRKQVDYFSYCGGFQILKALPNQDVKGRTYCETLGYAHKIYIQYAQEVAQLSPETRNKLGVNEEHLKKQLEQLKQVHLLEQSDRRFTGKANQLVK